VALFGAEGALGRRLREDALAAGAPLVSFVELDGERGKWPTIGEILAEFRPDVIVNATAAAHRETIGQEATRLRDVHAVDAERLAREAARLGLALVHISSDLVYDSAGAESLDEGSEVAPAGVLARALWEGEQAVMATCPSALIVRTGCLYGMEDTGFASLLCRRLAEGKAVQVGWERMGPPTAADDVVATLWELVRARCSGVYHVAAAGETSWAEVAHWAAGALGASSSLVSTGPRGDVAAWLPPLRPAILRPLRLEQEGRVSPRPWREALEEFLLSEVAEATNTAPRTRGGQWREGRGQAR